MPSCEPHRSPPSTSTFQLDRPISRVNQLAHRASRIAYPTQLLNRAGDLHRRGALAVTPAEDFIFAPLVRQLSNHRVPARRQIMTDHSSLLDSSRLLVAVGKPACSMRTCVPPSARSPASTAPPDSRPRKSPQQYESRFNGFHNKQLAVDHTVKFRHRLGTEIETAAQQPGSKSVFHPALTPAASVSVSGPPPLSGGAENNSQSTTASDPSLGIQSNPYKRDSSGQTCRAEQNAPLEISQSQNRRQRHPAGRR